MSIGDSHREEIARGARFAFGANWSRFLRTLNDDRIRQAEVSLRLRLSTERLNGKTFLDVGSGSGLFSLAARRLGAKVHSFDYDPLSVACTGELKRRYLPDDPDWRVERGSVLDRDYLARLGTFDVVYSWGVLHHTGAMWRALENVKSLVKPDGKLFIAIYNDLGAVTDRWAEVKRRYNALPAPLAFGYALTIIIPAELRAMMGQLRHGGISAWRRIWRDDASTSARGMSKWHDWVDWIGGYPFECATVERIADFYTKDGFTLVDLVDRTTGYGCNEFVFRHIGPTHSSIATAIPGGSSMLRRYGVPVVGPFMRGAAGWTGVLAAPAHGALHLFADGVWAGPIARESADRIVVAPGEAPESKVASASYFVIAGTLRAPRTPFRKHRGRTWIWETPDLAALADDKTANASPVYLLEEGQQLPFPHSLHEAIAEFGSGRFSHWGGGIYFAPTQNRDPNENPDRFRLFVVER